MYTWIYDLHSHTCTSKLSQLFAIIVLAALSNCVNNAIVRVVGGHWQNFCFVIWRPFRSKCCMREYKRPWTTRTEYISRCVHQFAKYVPVKVLRLVTHIRKVDRGNTRIGALAGVIGAFYRFRRLLLYPCYRLYNFVSGAWRAGLH